MRHKLTRRSVLAFGGLAAAGVSLQWVPTSWLSAGSAAQADRAFLEELIAAVELLDIPCTIGPAYLTASALNAAPESVVLLAGLVQERLGVGPDQMRGWPHPRLSLSHTELTARLAAAITEDFADGHVCTIEGWQLSETECRLAALKLLVRDGRQASSCLERYEKIQSRIAAIHPSFTVAGKGFNVQPTGRSVIVIKGSGFVSSSRVRLNGELTTPVFGNSELLSVDVPDELFAHAGQVTVVVEGPQGQKSNTVVLWVHVAGGDAPETRR
jgi:hypothetical protein